jgi:hypothetical protein
MLSHVSMVVISVTTQSDAPMPGTEFPPTLKGLTTSSMEHTAVYSVLVVCGRMEMFTFSTQEKTWAWL